MSKQATRRTNEERSLKTRTALIEAAIDIVFRCGYAGTTTAMIASQAGVSRGAILHHFGTRADLMAEMVRAVYEDSSRRFKQIENEASEPIPLEKMPSILWAELGGKSGTAVFDVLWASRSDQDLADKVLPMNQAIEAESLEAFKERFGALSSDQELMIRLLAWGTRGLIVADLLKPLNTGETATINLFQDILKGWLSSLKTLTSER